MPLLALGHKMALSLLTLMLGSALASNPRATKRDATAMIRPLGFGLDRHIDVNYVLSITFVVGQTTRKSSSKSFYVPFTPLLRLRHVQEIPSHSKLKAHP